MDRLIRYWLEVRTSLWFMPSVLVLLGIVLSLVLVQYDRSLSEDWQAPDFLVQGADAARAILSTIASTTITVTGVVFSVTIVTLSLASSQYTSRILRNFMADPVNQLVLGVFVSVYVYCLMVARTIRSTDEGHFVPVVAVGVAMFLALISIGFLITFIHHTASSIQASNILSSIHRETVSQIKELYPEWIDVHTGERHRKEQERYSHDITAQSTGYLQAINLTHLTKLAERFGVRVALQKRVGQFTAPGDLIMTYEGNALDDAAQQELLGALQFSHFRTIHQDPSFGIRQMVDIALKALSPGVNDSTTAVTAVDYISAVLAALAERELQTAKDRVTLQELPFKRYVEKGFTQIRQFAATNISVLVRMLVGLNRIANAVPVPSRFTVLEAEANNILMLAQQRVTQLEDLPAVERHYAVLMQTIAARRVHLTKGQA